MKLFSKFFLLMLVTAAATVMFIAYTELGRFESRGIAWSNESQTYEIKSGTSLNTLAENLEQQGIISSALLFKLMARLAGQAESIKAGDYELKPGMSALELLQLFVSGKTVQYQLAIIEGHTFKQLAEKIRSHPELIQTLSEDDYKNIMQVIGSDKLNPEGWFFPDTYSFPRNTTDVDFLKRAHAKMEEFLLSEWEKYGATPYIKTPYEVLIMASIVEKETGIPEERPLIAGVFLNRLKKGMLLQTDPTVIYGMGDRYQGNIRKSDLKRDTPYNTYTRAGLTPTPIATPSADAIHAVFKPAETDAYYFVARGDGGHYFSKTYAEHKKAVVKYLLNGRADRYKGDQ